MRGCVVQWGLRTFAIGSFIASFTWAIVIIVTKLEPSKDHFDLYEDNDDWR